MFYSSIKKHLVALFSEYLRSSDVTPEMKSVKKSAVSILNYISAREVNYISESVLKETGS